MVTELVQQRMRAMADLRRWSAELGTNETRGTLSAGMLRNAFSLLERILNQAASVFVAELPNGGIAEIGRASQGKYKSLERFTLGQCVTLLEQLESERKLGSKARVLTRADQALLSRLSRARNVFAHGTPSEELDVASAKMLLSDILQVCESNLVKLAISRQGA